MVEEINASIRAHESSVGDWYLKNAVKYFYQFFDLFNREWFSGGLPQAVISFRRQAPLTLGHYRFGRNEFGLKHEINLNSRHLERPFCQILATLLHEMIHLEEDLLGVRQTKRGNYHSKFFRDRSLALGIPSDDGGHTLEMTAPFTMFLEQNKVQIIHDKYDVGAFVSGGKGKTKKKAMKFSCGCTEVSSRSKGFSAVCKKCGREFRPVSS